jgi:asparagine synthase (glutamine-hydrolysing)
LISASVKKRVQSELPIAIFLSGGVDSSIILYEAIKHHPNVTAFSIGSQDSQDVKIGKRLCSKLNVPFVHVPIDSATLLKSIPDVVWSIESFEPNHIRGGTLSFFLSKEVAERGFKIALCGEGADELFGGYREFGIALEAGDSEDAIRGLFERFVKELYKTQLQRVDRTSMNFTLEVREPYLDKRILDFSYSLPITKKIGISSEGKWFNKSILREAYRGILPDWITSREKVVLSMGAGFGSNGPEGIFYENGLRMVSAQELINMQTKYPEYKINTSEEAYYFKIFLEKFGEIDLAKNRPLVNASPVTA